MQILSKRKNNIPVEKPVIHEFWAGGIFHGKFRVQKMIDEGLRRHEKFASNSVEGQAGGDAFVLLLLKQGSVCKGQIFPEKKIKFRKRRGKKQKEDQQTNKKEDKLNKTLQIQQTKQNPSKQTSAKENLRPQGGPTNKEGKKKQ